MTTSWTSRLIQLGSVLAVLFSVLIGLLFSNIPRRYGFYRWLSFHVETDYLKGMGPAYLEGVPDGYTYEKLSNEANLTNQNAIVTGANSGLGYWSSYHLALQGARVVMACRNLTKCEAAQKKINHALTIHKSRLYHGGSVIPMTLDTSSLESIRAFASLYTSENPGPLDMLLLNAGIGAKNDPKALSVDGIELIFATNHVGHQLLYNLLLPQILECGLKKRTGSRVVLTSSLTHYNAPPWGVGLTKKEILNTPVKLYYSQSKLAQVLFAQEATRRLLLINTEASSNVFVNSCNPGNVDTNIWTQAKKVFVSKKFFGPFFVKWIGPLIAKMISFLQKEYMFTSEEGALTQIFLAAAPEVMRSNIKGKYYHPHAKEVNPHPVFTKNLTLQIALWEFTETLINK